jgi:hypothetical protein
MTMAKPNDTSRARSGRNSDAIVIEAIDAERNRLMQVESLLDCILAAIDDDEVDPHGPYMPNVIQLSRDMSRKTVDQLDSLKLRPLLTAGENPYPASEGASSSDEDDIHKVKEPAALYLIQ